MLAFYEENREQYRTFALRFTYGYWWIQDYENHIRWFEIREREYNNLYFVNFDIAIKPNYWDKLEAWAASVPVVRFYRNIEIDDSVLPSDGGC